MTDRHPPESSSSSIPLYQVHGTLPTPCCGGVIVRDDVSDNNANKNGSQPPTLQVGQYGQVDWIYTTDMVMNYGRLVGDLNPLHQEWTQGNEPTAIRQSPLVRWISEDNGDNDDETMNGGIQDVNVTPPRPCTTVPVVHGMLVSSLFTGILGTLLPGAIYVRQSLEFRHPVYVGDHVTGRVTVVDIRRQRPAHRHNQDDTTKVLMVITCDTQVWLTHSPTTSSHVEERDHHRRSRHNQSREMRKECIRGQARMLLPEGLVSLDNEK